MLTSEEISVLGFNINSHSIKITSCTGMKILYIEILKNLPIKKVVELIR